MIYPADDIESFSVYLKKDMDVIRVHAIGFNTDQGFCQLEARCDLYNLNFELLGRLYGILGPVENEVKELKKSGWTEIQRYGGVA